MKRITLLCVLAVAFCGCGRKTIIGVSFPEAPIEIATNSDFGMELINMYNIIRIPDGTYRMYFIANPSDGIAEHEDMQNRSNVLGALPFTFFGFASSFGVSLTVAVSCCPIGFCSSTGGFTFAPHLGQNKSSSFIFAPHLLQYFIFPFPPYQMLPSPRVSICLIEAMPLESRVE